MHEPAREAPHEERVDRAEGELPLLGARARTLHVIEDPRDLGRREIRVEQQASALAHQRAVPRRLELGADRRAVAPGFRRARGLVRSEPGGGKCARGEAQGRRRGRVARRVERARHGHAPHGDARAQGRVLLARFSHGR